MLEMLKKSTASKLFVQVFIGLHYVLVQILDPFRYEGVVIDQLHRMEECSVTSSEFVERKKVASFHIGRLNLRLSAWRRRRQRT